MGTDGTSTPTNNERELLVARINYHKAMYDLLNSEVALYDAKATLAREQSDPAAFPPDLTVLQQSVYANVDVVTLAKANVAVASAAIERLQGTQDRRQTVARQISDLLFRPGSGLVDLIFVEDDIDDSDPLTPTSFLDGWFEARSSGAGFSSLFSRPIVIGEKFPRKRAPLSSLFDAWDDYDARRAAEANSDPDVGSPDKDQTPAG